MKIKEQYNKKLLVEGNDDQHILWALCDKYMIPQTFDVIDCDGIEKLFSQIPLRYKQSGINTIGIIVDADSDLSARWNKLQDILTKMQFTLPSTLPKNGLIIANPEGFSIGIWIMPNNKIDGMLEDFIRFLVPDDDKLLPIVEENLNSIENLGLNKYKQIHKSKATIHSWLSLQEVPGTPMGLSITKRYLTTDVTICQNLINWLRDLFS